MYRTDVSHFCGKAHGRWSSLFLRFNKLKTTRIFVLAVWCLVADISQYATNYHLGPRGDGGFAVQMISQLRTWGGGTPKFFANMM